jgi:hypothetical protein
LWSLKLACTTLFMENLGEPERITTEQVAALLTARGYPITAAALAARCARDAGPPSAIFGRTRTFDPDEALRWARGQLRPRRYRAGDVQPAAGVMG